MTRRCRAALFASCCVLAASFPAAARTIHVDMVNVAFAPANISARVGDTVEWLNKDFVAHTATARGGGWEVNLAPGASGHVALKKAGTIEYYCRLHPNMKGRISIGK